MKKIITEILPGKLNQNEVIDEIPLAHIGVKFVKALEKEKGDESRSKKEAYYFHMRKGYPEGKKGRLHEKNE